MLGNSEVLRTVTVCVGDLTGNILSKHYISCTSGKR